ncbi:MAG TPA: DUF2784 domain-containing protein [Telluria sp.]|nr:DUF2784 domain-containing protein [Telluria sp.]
MALTLSAEQYRLLADAVLVLHASIVAFVVFSLPLILAGSHWHWRWVRNFWFRISHLAAIAYVAAQTWFGIDCPLTTLEVTMRLRSGAVPYEGDFVSHWLSRILFYTAPPWVFLALYTGFALLVLYTWIRIPPQGPMRGTRVT